MPDLGPQSSCVDILSGHTSWADGGVNQTGMTSALTPNSQFNGSSGSMGGVLSLRMGQKAHLDLVGIREMHGGPTYAAVTSRSNHHGGVNVLLGDGSVRFLQESVAAPVWIALSTVGGNEIISSGDF